jgi:hypothetical protein
MSPGLKFFADARESLYSGVGLCPTMSTYGMLDLEGAPLRNELYVVCKDGSIQSVYSPNRPIGWELIEEGDEWYYRVTQMNHTPKRCIVHFHSRTDDPPKGRGRIGSVVMACRWCVQDEPQDACIEDTYLDDGEPEVTSKLRTIETLDPLLAQCAENISDPVQTDALAKFAEGKMSYAEMRGLCG